jgi:hypothetical protein
MAVAAYRAALEETTRAPLDWATTQMNLGTALQTLGERESGPARLCAPAQEREARTRSRNCSGVSVGGVGAGFGT